MIRSSSILGPVALSSLALSAILGISSAGCAYSAEADEGDDAPVAEASDLLTTIRVQAEDYRAGGEGVGYHDTTAGNTGGAYRQDDVDVEATADTGGGYDVGWVAAGEWLSYDFNAPVTASYQLTVRLSSHVVGTKTVHVEIDGAALPAVSYTDATGWQSWQTIALGTANLTAGAHAIKLVAENGGVNFNWIEAAYTPPVGISCPAGFATEVFRDDFNGSAVDTGKWTVVQQNVGGGEFTQLTKMLAANVSVSNGTLHIASKRHCADPYPNNAAEHPDACAGTNYYSGGWIKTNGSYAPGKGLMVFLAKMPAPVPGIFPALWARNLHGDMYYGEFDLIETWWDTAAKNNPINNTTTFASTTHMVTDAWHHTTGNLSPSFANMVGAFHVWEVQWDATAVPPTVSYYYRDAPGAARTLIRTVTYQTPGLSGYVTADQFATVLGDGWRPYIDFAVQPDTTWHIGPDTAATYDPADLEVDSVIVCKP